MVLSIRSGDLLDPKVLIYLAYIVAMSSIGMQYVRTSLRCYDDPMDDFCMFGVTLLWFEMGMFLLPIAMYFTNKIHLQHTQGNNREDIGWFQIGLMLLYGSSTYLIVVIFTHWAGEAGYWI